MGRIAIGKISRGAINEGDRISLTKRDGSIVKQKVKELYSFEGLGKKKIKTAKAGDICAVIGIQDFNIGETISDLETPEAMPLISIDEPTMNMTFSINNSPFFGKEGKLVTSRHIKDRLEKELEKNLALRIEPNESGERFIVYGRGIMHIGVLIETMRREGYELTVGQPQVITKEKEGVKMEPFEQLVIDLSLIHI